MCATLKESWRAAGRRRAAAREPGGGTVVHLGEQLLCQRISFSGVTMEGSFVRFYVRENERHRGVLLWEWLLRQGNGLGLRGGSAFRSIGGFGRRHAVHEERFFELAGGGAIEVEFVVGPEEEERLFSLLSGERLCLFYTRIPASFGVVTVAGSERSGAIDAR